MKVNALSQINPVNGTLPVARTQSEVAPKTNQESNPPVEEKVRTEEIESALKKFAEQLDKMADIGLEYSVDKDTNRQVVKVLDKQTGETIKQFPPEEILNVIKRIDEMLGFFMDEKV